MIAAVRMWRMLSFLTNSSSSVRTDAIAVDVNDHRLRFALQA